MQLMMKIRAKTTNKKEIRQTSQTIASLKHSYHNFSRWKSRDITGYNTEWSINVIILDIQFIEILENKKLSANFQIKLLL